jgi:phage tail tape-measure protein
MHSLSNTAVVKDSSPKKALEGAIKQGPLTAEVASKLIDGLASKYRENPQMVGLMAAVFGQAAVATPAQMNTWLGLVATVQNRIDQQG